MRWISSLLMLTSPARLSSAADCAAPISDRNRRNAPHTSASESDELECGREVRAATFPKGHGGARGPAPAPCVCASESMTSSLFHAAQRPGFLERRPPPQRTATVVPPRVAAPLPAARTTRTAGPPQSSSSTVPATAVPPPPPPVKRKSDHESDHALTAAPTAPAPAGAPITAAVGTSTQPPGKRAKLAAPPPPVANWLALKQVRSGQPARERRRDEGGAHLARNRPCAALGTLRWPRRN